MYCKWPNTLLYVLLWWLWTTAQGLLFIEWFHVVVQCVYKFRALQLSIHELVFPSDEIDLVHSVHYTLTHCSHFFFQYSSLPLPLSLFPHTLNYINIYMYVLFKECPYLAAKVCIYISTNATDHGSWYACVHTVIPSNGCVCVHTSLVG